MVVWLVSSKHKISKAGQRSRLLVDSKIRKAGQRRKEDTVG